MIKKATNNYQVNKIIDDLAAMLELFKPIAIYKWLSTKDKVIECLKNTIEKLEIINAGVQTQPTNQQNQDKTP